ncbi:hypothetical protein A0H81_14536 [Grifola frondosa]|uniref:Uncharacterized protein n=1 Tax=Grifola frondosa TaxID=5627 RepID=A0A1C7LNB6_GRIFR|nr:hypothetical protein A0H81_14536 [Grifola frondosa]
MSGMGSFGGDVVPHAADDGVGPIWYGIVEGTGVSIGGEDVGRMQAAALEITSHLSYKLFERACSMLSYHLRELHILHPI